MTDNFSYYLGLDIGASKTHALIVDAAGGIIGAGSGGPGNWEGVGLDGARQSWVAALEAALADGGIGRDRLCAAAYGAAGYDLPSDDGRLRPLVKSLGVPGPFFLDNDSFIALRAGTSRPYGVVCIAGSGSTKAGRNRQGETFRTWGLSGEMGDWGGGGDICYAAIGAVARAHKSIDPPTALTGLLLAHFGLPNVDALVESQIRDCVYRIDFTHLVFQAAADGDTAARTILVRSARALAEATNAVIRGLGMAGESFELVLAGGVFRGEYPLLRDTLTEAVRAVAPGVTVVRLTAPPVVGAALLAMEMAGLAPDENVRHTLIAGAEATLHPSDD